jgi:hypothetical protein
MLTKGQLLDRMELLYPYEGRFTDLRRAYIDRDENSIHRLMVDCYGNDIDKMKKAFRDDNWHHMFHLIEGDWIPQFTVPDGVEQGDLRKFLFQDNTWSMYRLLLNIQDTQIIKTIKSFHASGTRIDNDSLSQGQLKSKMWLIDELKTLDLKLGTVFLCAGWYGILATLMFEHDFDIDKVRSFDVDPNAAPIADKFNLPWFSDGWKFKAITEDIHNIDFEEHGWQAWSNSKNRLSKTIREVPNTIINTSCEHIEHFDRWYGSIPSGKLMILQSNNFEDIDEHVNTHPTLDSFTLQTPMNEVLFSGQMDLDKYSRYMRIGYK